MNSSKFKRIKVQVNSVGSGYILMRPIQVDMFKEGEDGTLESICTYFCPYGPRIAGNLPDPRDISDKLGSFCDYCSCLPVDRDQEIDLVPVEGELERYYGKDQLVDATKELATSDNIVNLRDIIDYVCPGSCPDYKVDHSGCTDKNLFCIFRDLIRKKNIRGENLKELFKYLAEKREEDKNEQQ